MSNRIKGKKTQKLIWLLGFGENLSQLFFVQYSLYLLRPDKYNNLPDNNKKAFASFN